MSFFSKYVKSAVGILKRNKVIFENFSYLTLFQVLSLLFPLITYPYLTRTLGTELYGLVITAQILSSYCSILIQFGFPLVSARHISLHKDDKDELSKIMSSILCMQLILWILSFLIYLGVIYFVPTYNEHFLLFFYSFFLTFTNVLFPQFYFQGIEKMKYITIIQLIFQLLFIALIFVVINDKTDYVYVPVLHSIGYLIGGIIALYIIFVKDGVKLIRPKYSDIKYYTKDALPIFSTNVICTIKDKLNYLLLGSMVNMSQVVTYDVGSKLHSLIMKPIEIILTVIFPKMARDKDNQQLKKMGIIIFAIALCLVLVVNLFLNQITMYFIGKEIDMFPIRLLLISPLLLGVSGLISRCFLVARGYNKYMLYSIIVTTSVYVILLLCLFVMGRLNSITAFITLTVISYAAELIYRLFVMKRLVDKNENL